MKGAASEIAPALDMLLWSVPSCPKSWLKWANRPGLASHTRAGAASTQR